MKTLAAITAVSALALGASPALAKNGWTVEMSGAIDAPMAIGQVALSEELAANADKIGPADLDELLIEMREDVSHSLDKAGLLAGTAEAPITVNLYLNSAEPNRPTHWQLSGKGDFGYDDADNRRSPSYSSNLSLDSIAIGEFDATAEFVGANGQVIGTASYHYEPFTIQDVQGYATWTAANRGIDRFARGLPGKLEPTS